MSFPAVPSEPVTQTAIAISPRALYIGVLAITLLGAAFYVPDPIFTLLFLAAGGTLASLAVISRTIAGRHAKSVVTQSNLIESITLNDPSACFITDKDGEIMFMNSLAAESFKDSSDKTLAHAFRDYFANPSAVFFRLQNKAHAIGGAREDVVTRRGHTRLSVHQVGPQSFLWRVDDFGERNQNSRGAEGISLPMLTASKSGTVLFMNEALRRVLGGRVKTLDRIFCDMPPKIGFENEISGRDGPITARIAEIEGAGGRREIYFLPWESAPDEHTSQQLLFEDLPVPILEIVPGGEIAKANKRARELLADPLMAGTIISDLVEGLGRSVRDWLDDAFAGRGLHHSEVIRAKRPEKETYLQITLNKIQQDGEDRLVAVLTDATELKTLEAQFVQSQKMQAIGQLAGGVAHDFNNLLTAITGHCDLLLLRRDQGDPDFADLSQINQNANRAASLVGQLLAFSRKQNLKPEIIDLRESLSDLTHLLSRLVGERVSLSLSHDPELTPVRVDKRQLEQVIMNLVVNARDAMPSGGEIKIETDGIVLKEPYFRDRAEIPPGEYVTIRVSDKGFGIAEDKRTKIFEPFYTTKRTGEGTGLGLSMAYGIIKQSGGFIFVDSELGVGTTFTLYFPTFSKSPVPGKSADTGDDNALIEKGEGVVLLVEDEAPVRAFASRALRMRGYTVLEADSAEHALETLEDLSLDVDIFVTDVIMPGMDGPSWVRQALKDRPDVKVVFVSGYAQDAFGDDPDEFPNSVFLPKPFSLKDLTKMVQKQLH